MNKIYPFRWYEKVSVSCLMGLAIMGTIPLGNEIITPTEPKVETSQFCLNVCPFIFCIGYCWDVNPKVKSKELTPDTSESGCGIQGVCRPECPCN